MSAVACYEEQALPHRKVIIVCGAGSVSGKEIVSLLLASGLRDAGVNVEFVTSQWSDGEFVRRLELNGFKYRQLRLGFISVSLQVKPLMMTLDQFRFLPILIYRYTRFIRAAAPQTVIHTNWHHALLLLPFLDRHRDIFWVHEVFPNVPHYGQMLRAIAKRVGRIVCVSHAVARSVIALGVPISQVTVIHNGLLPVNLKPVSIDQTELQLGIVGQVGAWKGHDDLLDALALLARDGVRPKLKIFGTGNFEYIESLKQKAIHLNLNDQIEWCGFVSDQLKIFSNINLCIVPSRSEDPLPTAALEAGAFGRPVVGSSSGGLPEIVEPGVSGLLVRPRCPDQLAQAIRKFACQPKLLGTMGEAAQRRVRAEFSLSSFVSRFIGVIEEITVRQ